MAHQELVDGLIATYRELNAKVRPLPEARLTAPGAESGSVRDVLVRMRDNELRFSQALKERLTGVPMPEMFGEDETVVIGTESARDSTLAVLSQFGTARESTLTLLRSLSEQQWDEPTETGHTLAGRVQQLLDHDRRQVDRINGLLATP